QSQRRKLDLLVRETLEVNQTNTLQHGAAESIRSLRPIRSPSRHPRIPELQEQRPVGPRQVDPLIAEGVVRVADEEDGLRVQLVGEKELAEQRLRVIVH